MWKPTQPPAHVQPQVPPMSLFLGPSWPTDSDLPDQIAEKESRLPTTLVQQTPPPGLTPTLLPIALRPAHQGGQAYPWANPGLQHGGYWPGQAWAADRKLGASSKCGTHRVNQSSTSYLAFSEKGKIGRLFVVNGLRLEFFVIPPIRPDSAWNSNWTHNKGGLGAMS